MLRRVFALAVLVVVSVPIDLGACGDKFLRPGRSGRWQSYAAMYPASILLYRTPTARLEVVNNWQKMLRKAGHKPRVVQAGSDFSQTVAGARYDLVIADFREAEKVNAALQGMSARPGVLPVMSSTNSTRLEDAKKQYALVIDPESMNEVQALEAIDELMARRQKTGK
jgi:hypothetical protein